MYLFLYSRNTAAHFFGATCRNRAIFLLWRFKKILLEEYLMPNLLKMQGKQIFVL